MLKAVPVLVAVPVPVPVPEALIESVEDRDSELVEEAVTVFDVEAVCEDEDVPELVDVPVRLAVPEDELLGVPELEPVCVCVSAEEGVGEAVDELVAALLDVALEVAVIDCVAAAVAVTEAVLEAGAVAEAVPVDADVAVELPVPLLVGVTAAVPLLVKDAVREGVISAMHHVTVVSASALSNPLMPRTPIVKRCKPDAGRTYVIDCQPVCPRELTLLMESMYASNEAPVSFRVSRMKAAPENKGAVTGAAVSNARVSARTVPA